MVGSGDLRMALPWWLVPFDTTATLFANEPLRPGGDGFLELTAEGPQTLIPLPAPRESLEAWLERRIEPWGPGEGAARWVELPAGSGVLIERILAPVPHAWRLAAYAIQTPVGVAYLLVDGPPESWMGHEDDITLIPMLMELGGRPT